MDSPNLGPLKYWLTVLIFAVVGIIATITGIIYAAIWLYHHVKIQ
jgi:hypothetical protein